MNSNKKSFFFKKILWDGKFICIDKTCEISNFKCSAKRDIHRNVEVHVFFDNKEVSHEKILNKLIIMGEKRWDQKFSLAANGICNTQSFNSIYNSTINDPSNFLYGKMK